MRSSPASVLPGWHVRRSLVCAIALALPNTASAVQIVIVHVALVAAFAGAGLLFRYASRKEFRVRATAAG